MISNVIYDIIVSSMKSYPWNHSQACDVMQSCLWNHSDTYDIIDLWYHKTMISWIQGYDIITHMMSYPHNMNHNVTSYMISYVLWYHRYDIIKPWYHDLWYHRSKLWYHRSKLWYHSFNYDIRGTKVPDVPVLLPEPRRAGLHGVAPSWIRSGLFLHNSVLYDVGLQHK